MKNLLFASSAIALFAGTASFAAITVDDVVKTFQDDGYESIEVKRGLSQIKVEAVKGGQKLEAIYDIETGEILKQEIQAAEAGDGAAGLEISTRNRNFLDDDDHDEDADDDNDDDRDDDHGDDGADDPDDDDGNDSDDDQDDDSDDDHGDDHD